MKSKNKWIVVRIVLVVYLAVFIAAPAVFAQAQSESRKSLQNMQYLQYLYEFLQQNYVDPVDQDVLYRGAMAGMLNALQDPYTVYIDNDSLTGVDLHDTTTGFFGGIGITFIKPAVSTPEKPAYVEVSSPIEDTPSWQAGIQAGDFITEIEGQSTIEMTNTDVVAKLRGQIGSPVTVTIRRGKTMEFPIKLIRAKIEVPTIKYAKIDKNIGYIRLIEFNPNSYPRIRDAMAALQNEGVSRFILDLRNNPGGLLDAAVDTASLFIKEGTVVSTKSRIAEQNTVYNTNTDIDPLFADVPLITLINKGSASAAEILAGALKDHKRSYLIGETSFGKGVVQTVINLTKRDSFKMTISRYYTPSDANIDKLGIQPDKEVLPFPALSTAEEKGLEQLFKDKKIIDLVKNSQTLTFEQITGHAEKLADTYGLTPALTRYLIRAEYNRTHTAPIADVDYDQPLQEAVRILQSGTLTQLLQKSKSVRQMQEETLNAQEKGIKKAS